MSIHEEATYSVVVPIMGVMNNLVLFHQDEQQNSMDIVPDLAESWSWSEDGKELTFKLRQGVKWHDGKPFTAADVSARGTCCRGRPRTGSRQPAQGLVQQCRRSSTNGDYEAIFKLERPQPALLTLLASGYSPIYPCHSRRSRCGSTRSARDLQVRRVQAERGDQGG